MSGDRSGALLEWVRAAPSTQDIDYALRKAAAIHQWCLRGLPVQEGDHVRIIAEVPTDNGWAPYREALAVGAAAAVVGIDFNVHTDGWYADIRLDREWSVSRWVTSTNTTMTKRYWNGPADETPDGYEPPSNYDRATYPEGRKHLFSMPVEWLEPLPPVVDGASREGAETR